MADVVKEWVKKSVDHFERQYPDYNKDNTTMFPPVYSNRYQSSISKGASGYAELKSGDDGNTSGDEAEARVFDALSQSMQPMFVFTNLEFSSFIQYILGKSTTGVTCEVDFLIIHWRIGVLLLEVKAGDKNRKKAKEQLNTREKIIRELLGVLKEQLTNGCANQLASNQPNRIDNEVQDSCLQASSQAESQTQINEEIPIYKIYVTPNDELTSSGIKSEQAVFHLDKKALGDISGWLKQPEIPEKIFDGRECKLLQKLCSVLFGQRTEIKAKGLQRQFSDRLTPSKTERDSLRSQEHLKQSYKKQRNMEKEKRSVIPTADLDSLNNQFLFVTREQFDVWNGSHHRLIEGVSGSGKTILLQCKALQCAMNGDKVTVFARGAILYLYQKFFEDRKATVHFIKEREVYDLLLDGNRDCHFFADDFQSYMCTKKWVSVKVNEDNDKYCWIAFDRMQSFSPVPDEALEKGDYAKSKSLVEDVNEMLKHNKKKLTKVVLNTSMRSTKLIFEFIQHYRRSVGATTGPYQQIEIGNNIRGDKVKVYMVKRANQALPIEKSRIHPDALVETVEVKNEAELFVRCADIVIEESDGMYDSCAVLTKDMSFMYVKDALKLKSVCVRSANEFHTSDAVAINLHIGVLSYEWDTVFVIGKPEDFLHNYHAMTRAIFKLVVIFI